MGIADALELPLLEHPQQLRLQRRAHRPDLVEEERALVGLFEPALTGGDRAGEGAPHVAEQLRFEQCFGNRAAVERDEPIVAPRTVVVQRPGRELLAGAGLAGDQHGARGRRDGFQQVIEIAHHPARADQPVDAIALFELRAQVGVLGPQPPLLERRAEHVQQRVELERLGDEVGGALLDRVHRVLHGAEAGDHDRDDVRVALERRVQDVTPIDAREPQIGEQDVEGECRQPFERLLATVCLLDQEPMIGEPLGDRLAERRLVVYDQQMFRGVSHLCGRTVF